MEVIIGLFGGIFLLLVAFFTGRVFEKRHYQSIREREQHFLQQPAVTARFSDPSREIELATCVTGSIVVSVDHFKRFLSKFRLIFGGEMKSYASLIDRGRREAILRMKEACPQADIYVNLRLQTSTISKGVNEKSVGCVEVLATSTAVTYKK